MPNKQATPPLELIKTKPQRKTRSETILRLLISTSYPHSFVGNMVLDVAQGAQVYDQGQLEELARDIREHERTMQMFDFIRHVQIRRVDETITVLAKRMFNLNDMQLITDSPKNHELYMEHEIGVDPDLVLDNARHIAESILLAFYRTQVKGMHKFCIAPHTKWKAHTRELAMDSKKTEASLKALRTSTRVMRLRTDNAIDLIAESLIKPAFNIELSTSTLILHDQSTRIQMVTQ